MFGFFVCTGVNAHVLFCVYLKKQLGVYFGFQKYTSEG